VTPCPHTDYLDIGWDGDQRRYHEFMGKDSTSVDGLEAKRAMLPDATLQYCRDNDLGEHVHVRAFEDDGIAVFQIIRSHHTKKPLAVVRGSQARATIEYRPVHADIVRGRRPACEEESTDRERSPAGQRADCCRHVPG
jgi:hypothetical protein